MVYEFVRMCLDEDLGRGDLFERCLFDDSSAQSVVVAKSDGVFSGRIYVDALASIRGIRVAFDKSDGDAFHRGERLLVLEGKFISIVQVERVLLNILQHSSGIATKTHEIFSSVRDSGLTLLDTRKTRPLLRSFEKYSTRNGGAINHRLGLDDCLMIKDSHLVRIGDIGSFITSARSKIPWTSKIEVEVESYELAVDCFESGVDIIMCDNMDIEEIAKVVRLRNERYTRTLIEASGNITKENIEAYSNIGVDAVSSGALIHGAVWPDLSMSVR